MSRKRTFTVAAARARARTAADAIEVAIEGALACVVARGGGSLRAEIGDRAWEVIRRAVRARWPLTGRRVLENQNVILKNISGDVWTCAECTKTVQPGAEHRCGSDADMTAETKKIVDDAAARGMPFSDSEVERVRRDNDGGSAPS